jgi:hypothetical protein
MLEELKGLGGKILMTSLSHEDEAKLQAALVKPAKTSRPVGIYQDFYLWRLNPYFLRTASTPVFSASLTIVSSFSLLKRLGLPDRGGDLE